MSKNYDFDYIIIGSGPAGRTVAKKLAAAKKRVAIVEYNSLGGAEINTRDFPYQYSLDFATNFHKFITSPAAANSSCHFNFPTLLTNMDNTISAMQSTIASNLQNLGITLIGGFASFIDSHTIAIDDNTVTSNYFILATGSELKASEISGLDSVDFLDPDTAMRIRRLPRYVFVIGGGPTGVQIAEFFAMLGTGVILMERGDHLLPREDEDIAKTLTSYLVDTLGVTVVTNARVTAITEDYTSKIVVFMNGAGEKMVRVDTIILATGSEPFTDYSLENAGVDYKRTGIITDKYLNTTAKNIFAIGDARGTDNSSTERSILEANTLAENLLHRQRTPLKTSGLVRKIGTYPAIAISGLNERDALSRDLTYHKSIIPLKDLPGFYHSDLDQGFIKILTDRSGRTIGTSIIAPSADLALQLKSLLTK